MNQQFQEKIAPVFIVGTGRSGSTLLRAILNASNQIHIPYESEFIARVYPYYHDKTHFNEDDYRQIARFFINTSEKNGWGMKREYLTLCLKERAPQSLADINSTIYEAYLKLQGLENLRWGIKTPFLVAHIDRIFAVFPQAKIIHLVRDGRDVYLSYRKVHENDKIEEKDKFGPKGAVTTALYWIDGLRRIEELHDGQVYELQYENLLNHPDAEIKMLCAFLDIDYNSSMYENYQESDSNKNLLLEKHKQTIHAKIESRFDPTNMKKYLSNMSKLDRFIFELIGVPYLNKYHYPIEFQVLDTIFLKPIRGFLYFGARQLNNWRYRNRDVQVYKKVFPQKSGFRVPTVKVKIRRLFTLTYS